jgi:hypothetical protein
VTQDPDWLAELTARARDALAAELSGEAAVSPDELARRGRDYRSWQLMRSYPARVTRLAHGVLAQARPTRPPPDPENFREICLTLTGMLAGLCEEAAREGARPHFHAQTRSVGPVVEPGDDQDCPQHGLSRPAPPQAF